MDDDFFSTGIIRVPLFPFNYYRQLQDRTMSLNDLLNNCTFMNAIYLASPELHELCLQIKNGTIVDRKKFEKVEASIFKYASRICTRCTPFGLFSAVGTFQVQESKSSILLKTYEQHKTFLRIDADLLCLLARRIGSHMLVAPYLKYKKNSTLYQIGQYYRYIEVGYDSEYRKYELISVEATPIIEKLLSVGESWTFIENYVDAVLEGGVTYEAAKDFIFQLIDSQILISELEPSPTGPDMDKQLLDTLSAIASRVSAPSTLEYITGAVNQLQELKRTLNEMENVGVQNTIVCDGLKKDFEYFSVPIKSKYVFQCDTLANSIEGHLNQEVVGVVKDAISVVERLSVQGKNKKIERFIESFIERYGDREMSLVEVLDVENGIGYGNQQETIELDFSELIDDIPFLRVDSSLMEVQWHKEIHSFLSQKIFKAYRERSLVIDITDGEILNLSSSQAGNPKKYNSYFASINILKDNSDSDLIIFNAFGGQTAASWIGRFCHMSDEIKELTLNITDIEDKLNPERLVAEINHLPQDRLGNVIQRPILRKYEIPYVAKSYVENDSQISPTDLKISIRNGEIVIRSEKHDKEVIPYITNAHVHYVNSLPLYHFLGDLQLEQNNRGGALTLGVLERAFKYIPRIQYKNVILRRASWTLNKEEILTLVAKGGNELINYFDELANQQNIPLNFLIVERDNELLINRKSIESLRAFKKEVKNLEEVSIFEFPLSDTSVSSSVKDQCGNDYNNELLLFFHRKIQESATGTAASSKKLTPSVIADFVPGSRWLYFKIYTGFKSSNEILKLLAHKLESLKDKELIKEWFYIRYFDPKFHLRVRLLMSNIQDFNAVFNDLSEFWDQLLNEKTVWNVMVDTYKREIERYGEYNITSVESIFYHDSLMCSKCINAMSEREKWFAAIYSSHSFLNLFDLTLESRQRFLEDITQQMGLEFGSSRDTKRSITQKYKELQEGIDFLLTGTDSGSSQNTLQFERVKSFVRERDEAILSMIDSIKEQTLSESFLFNIIYSLIHLNVNRLFKTRQRVFEFLFYSFLKIHYTKQKHLTQNEKTVS